MNILPLVRTTAENVAALVRTAADSNAIIVVRKASAEGASRMDSGELVDVEVFEWPPGLVSADNDT